MKHHFRSNKNCAGRVFAKPTLDFPIPANSSNSILPPAQWRNDRPGYPVRGAKFSIF